MAESVEDTDFATPERTWEEPFITALASYGVVVHACKKAKIDRKTVYRHRAADPVFAARWDEALKMAVETLEAEAIRRARDGYLKPVYQKGELVGKVRDYSDTLLIFLLKGLKPHVYRDPAMGAAADSLLAELIRGAIRGDVAERKAIGGPAQQPGEAGGDGPPPAVEDPAARPAD